MCNSFFSWQFNVLLRLVTEMPTLGFLSDHRVTLKFHNVHILLEKWKTNQQNLLLFRQNGSLTVIEQERCVDSFGSCNPGNIKRSFKQTNKKIS